MTSVRPLATVHIDLAEGVEGLRAPEDGRDLYAIFWWREIPIGHLHATAEQLAGGRAALLQLVANRITPAVADRIMPGFAGEAPGRVDDEEPPSLAEILSVETPFQLLEESTAKRTEPSNPPRVSIVVCTRDRPEVLRGCLHSLGALSTPPDEVVVVDNSTSSSEAVQRVVGETLPGTSYVREERPGLSRARNAGVRATRGEIVAFTDDDATVHRDWLWRLRDAFTEPDVMVVTGLVLPAALETESQVVFETVFGGFFRGFQRIVYDTDFFEQTRSHPVPVWKIGAGANMAVRRRAFELVGEFDERLGAGAAGCSEDSEFWYRLLAEGFRCRYEPAAVAFHRHREDLLGLKRQLHDYMRGHVAALFVQHARHRDRANLVRAFFALPRDFAARGAREYVFHSRPRTGTFLAGLSGYLRGLRYVVLARPTRVARQEPTAPARSPGPDADP
jgi:GT2 family glycosyltransferase